MREREKIRDRKRAAKLDCHLDAKILEQYIEACQCPFCKDGIVYKMLSLHISQMHGMLAYDLRKDFSLNRKHKLISRETSEIMCEMNKRNGAAQRLLQHPNWGNLENRYKDGGQRDEAIQNKRIIAGQPEVKQRFANVMAKVDRKAVAASIPPEARKARACHARMIWELKVPLERQKEIMTMTLARSLRTPESENIRKQHAAETMNKLYRSNPIWRDKWRKRITEVLQAKAKVPRSDYASIVSLYENGMSQPEIASRYSVSRSLIHIIIKSQKLGLPKLYN